jgi:hypothetical protein
MGCSGMKMGWRKKRRWKGGEILQENEKEKVFFPNWNSFSFQDSYVREIF